MKRNSIIIILGITLVIGFFVFPMIFTQENVTQDIEVKLASMSFRSVETDHSIMEVQYLLGIKNHGQTAHDFRLKISPKDLEWYPYLHCIPEVFTSEIISLESGQGDFMELTTLYQSSEDRSTNGHLSDQDLIIEVIEANLGHMENTKSWQNAYAPILDGRENPLKNNATGYALIHLNDDDIPELIMNYGEDRNIIYTANDQGPILLEHTYKTLYLSPENDLIDYGGWGTGIGGVKAYYLENNSLKSKVIMIYDVQPAMDIEVYEHKGQEIDLEDFEETLKTYTSRKLPFNELEQTDTPIDINNIEIGKTYTIVVKEGELYNYEDLDGEDFDLLKGEEVNKLKNYMKENNLVIKADSYDVNQVYEFEDFIRVFEFESSDEVLRRINEALSSSK